MPTFGLKYYAELRSKYKGVFWRVEIAERGYNGTETRYLLLCLHIIPLV